MFIAIAFILPHVEMSEAEMKRIQEKEQAKREKEPSFITKVLVGSAIIDALDGDNKKEKKDKK